VGTADEFVKRVAADDNASYARLVVALGNEVSDRLRLARRMDAASSFADNVNRLLVDIGAPTMLIYANYRLSERGRLLGRHTRRPSERARPSRRRGAGEFGGRCCVVATHSTRTCEMQCARLIERRRTSPESTNAKQPRLHATPAVAELTAVLKSLGFSRPPDNIESTVLFEKIIARVRSIGCSFDCRQVAERVAKLPPAYVSSVIHAPLIDGAELTPVQWARMDALNTVRLID